jgi:Tfp pilus assembly protein PilF
LKLGKVNDAEACLKNAVSIDAGYLEAALQLAGLYANQNRLKEAEEHFTSAIGHARTQQQLATIFSLKAAALSQARVCERYPDLKVKITY